jgi:hypothetical protein
MQLEQHISAIVVQVVVKVLLRRQQWNWCETEPVVVCCVFVFVGNCCGKVHCCGVGRLRPWLFSLSVFASGDVFCSLSIQLAKCCRRSRQPQSCSRPLIHVRTQCKCSRNNQWSVLTLVWYHGVYVTPVLFDWLFFENVTNTDIAFYVFFFVRPS